jgi:hypothetical protein
MKKVGRLIEILFVFTLLLALTQLLNHFALKPAVEGNPEPGGIIFGIFSGVSKVMDFIWDKAGPVILGIMIVTGILIAINMLLSRGKSDKYYGKQK